MKTISISGFLLLGLALHSQTINQAATGSTALPAPTPYVVVSRDANSAVWQRETYDSGPHGTVVTNVHRYVELATGLNHLVNGQYVPSAENIAISPDGSTAMATNGQHQVYFPGNIYSGVIKLVMPDGKALRSQPIGLSYSDGTNSVLLAVVTNSTGAILPSGNQVIYTNAFAGLDADLLYTYTKAGFEQDVVLRQQPPDPVSLGLNSASTRLQVLTEFINPPRPNVTAASLRTAAGNLEDDNLNFGAMVMGKGKAFLLGTNSQSAGVEKHWLTLNRRQFLIEEVPIVSVATAIESLPPFTAQTGLAKPVVSKNLVLPLPRLVQAAPQTRFLAQAVPPGQGLVLDYVTFNGGVTNYTFQGDTTYYITNGVYLTSGNFTFEGGAVLKYARGAALGLVAGPPNLQINWLASAYRPVIFTAMDDNSVGESIGSGNPTGYYANPALYVIASNPKLSHLRVAYAQLGLEFAGNSGLVLSDAQLVNCQQGVFLNYGNISIENALFANVVTNLSSLYEASILIQNATFANSFCLETGETGTTNNMVNVSFTNCVFANVTNNFYSYDTFSGDHNGFYRSYSFGTSQVTTSSNPFQAVGAGSYYLTNGCTFTNAGTTNIDPVLLAGLSKKTVYPPLMASNTNITTTQALTLGPWAPRDTNGSPSLGYHYDPLDYLWSQISIGPPVTVQNGVAIGLFGTLGFNNTGGGFNSQGLADAMNHLVWYPSVQEQPVRLNNISTVGSALFAGTAGATPKLITLRFTDMSMMGSRQRFFDNCFSFSGPIVNVRDSWLRGVSLVVYQYFNQGFIGSSVTIQNCLVDRSTMTLNAGYINYYNNIIQNPLNVTLYNNLFRQSSLSLINSCLQTFYPFYSYMTVKDNLFDTSSFAFGGDGNYTNYMNVSNNGYYQTVDGYPGPNDLTVTNLAYALGPLGPWYIGFSSPTVLYAGSRSAASAGLYHYTIQTNLQWNSSTGDYCEIPDGTNTVSISYHYVATDQYGNPLDSNGNGIPDYLEDPSGTGQPLTITLVTPANNSHFKEPATIPMQATVFDWSGLVTNVTFFNGLTNLTALASAPYNYNWPIVAAGSYTVEAEAFDNKGATAFSSLASVTVTNLCH